MDVRHELGGNMEITLSQSELNALSLPNPGVLDQREGEANETLSVFIVNDKHPEVIVPDAQFFDESSGVYIPDRMLNVHALRLATEFNKPVAVVENDRISEMNESRTRKIDLFGKSGQIIVKLAAQA